MPALGLCARQTWTFVTMRCPALTAGRESQATQDTADLLTQASATFDVRNKKACYITVAPTQTLSPAPMFTSTSIPDGHPQHTRSPPQSPHLHRTTLPPVPPTTTFTLGSMWPSVQGPRRAVCTIYRHTRGRTGQISLTGRNL